MSLIKESEETIKELNERIKVLEETIQRKQCNIDYLVDILNDIHYSTKVCSECGWADHKDKFSDCDECDNSVCSSCFQDADPLQKSKDDTEFLCRECYEEKIKKQ